MITKSKYIYEQKIMQYDKKELKYFKEIYPSSPLNTGSRFIPFINTDTKRISNNIGK